MINRSRRKLKKHIQKKTPTFSIDLYLSRLSHLSQMGLLIVAVIGYFYTVVPLYQKSLLDEQIAQKELELKSQQKALKETYIKLRRDTLRFFLFHNGAACSGLLRKPESLIRKNLNFSDYVLNRRAIYDLRPATCLAKNFENATRIKENLQKKDIDFFNDQIKLFGKDFEALRITSLNEFDTYLDKVKSNPEVLEPLDPNSVSARSLNLLRPHISPEFYHKEIFEARVMQGLKGITSKYGDQIREKISELNDIQWPD